MEPAFDSLAAYRKLEESGMPEPQADAAVEVVNNAMQNFVTKEYLTSELDRRFTDFKSEMDKRFVSVDKRFSKIDKRFTKLEAKIDTSIAKLGRSQARGLLAACAINMAFVSLLFVALQYFDGVASTAPGVSAEPPAPSPTSESEAAEPTDPAPIQPRRTQ